MGSIVRLLEQSARRHPGRTALQTARETVTYADLWRHALQTAARLRALGLAPGDRVALALDNSPAYAAAFYGIVAAGGIAVALNPAAKARDFIHWLGHSGSRWVFTGDDDRDVALACEQLASPPQRLRLQPLEAGDAAPAPDLPESAPTLLLYTSGTTGNPKGVLLSHANLAANTQAIVSYLQLGADDRSVVVLPFFYSYGNSVLHTHLAAGATLVLEAGLTYPQRVVEALARHRATGFAGVPSTFELLLARGDLASHDLSALRYVTQAGGAMSEGLARRLQAALPQAAVVVMYGQTEATARISWLPPQRLADKPRSVGIAVDGTEIAVRHDDGRPAGPADPGEVWVRGPGVMLGYWHNPEATAEVLHGGWLRTGDLGWLDDEGFLFLAGRRSEMIKTGAHRVSPQDVEEVIEEMPGVAAVAVVPQPDELLGETIRAVVVPAEGAALTDLRVKAWCRERLAPHKIPKTVDFVAELPRTASGKVRRHQLVPGGTA